MLSQSEDPLLQPRTLHGDFVVYMTILNLVNGVGRLHVQRACQATS